MNTADCSLMTAIGMTALHLRITDLNSPIALSFATDYQIQNLFWDRHSEEIFHFLCMGQGKEIVTYKEMENS